ncbi:AraC family transcriptional regulator [Priestia aryabhattai]|uniref:AraC family transcriptional regulator n=1 Tax=Bacillaceae TaxID=186817 RepID=UPI000BA0EB21|nr:AraC family transcriptional regulator [Bacillus sp. CBEL-1]OZT11745.1 AraC family transcriptional regulator [Priestia aryabhattai]TDB53080.1 AraC family transcriptional regulator [Bacillus sp. CBEL-1]USY55966.1 AraC family transcriptional regulator [Bacillus sp. 1780r2a1]
MTYEQCVLNTIDYIEDHLHDSITLEQLAEVACFSPFHYHRVFQTLVGESVMEYVRKRKLTAAAQRLFYTNDKVIDIAFDLGFQYTESFNRSFKKVYGLSPKEYRSANMLCGPLRGKAYLQKPVTGGNKVKPMLITKDAFHIIGYELRTKNVDGQNNKDIPAFWTHYLKNQLSTKIPKPLYKNKELGICTDFTPSTGEFTYIIGMEVQEDTAAPEGLTYRSFPKIDYAVFTTPKSSEDDFTFSIQSTWNYVFTEWFPQSGYEHYGSMEFELYDERCFGKTDKQIDLYIPIQKKLSKA